MTEEHPEVIMFHNISHRLAVTDRPKWIETLQLSPGRRMVIDLHREAYKQSTL